MHLWFLYVLLILYAAATTARVVVARFDREGRVARLADTAVGGLLGPWAALGLALPVALGLYLHPYWLMWFGIPTPGRLAVPESRGADHLRSGVRPRLARAAAGGLDPAAMDP